MGWALVQSCSILVILSIICFQDMFCAVKRENIRINIPAKCNDTADPKPAVDSGQVVTGNVVSARIKVSDAARCDCIHIEKETNDERLKGDHLLNESV
jgi:hypothetical protein